MAEPFCLVRPHSTLPCETGLEPDSSKRRRYQRSHEPRSGRCPTEWPVSFPPLRSHGRRLANRQAGRLSCIILQTQCGTAGSHGFEFHGHKAGVQASCRNTAVFTGCEIYPMCRPRGQDHAGATLECPASSRFRVKTAERGRTRQDGRAITRMAEAGPPSRERVTNATVSSRTPIRLPYYGTGWTVPSNVPREQSGTEGPATTSARHFTDALIQRFLTWFVGADSICRSR